MEELTVLFNAKLRHALRLLVEATLVEERDRLKREFAARSAQDMIALEDAFNIIDNELPHEMVSKSTD